MTWNRPNSLFYVVGVSYIMSFLSFSDVFVIKVLISGEVGRGLRWVDFFSRVGFFFPLERLGNVSSELGDGEGVFIQRQLTN